MGELAPCRVVWAGPRVGSGAGPAEKLCVTTRQPAFQGTRGHGLESGLRGGCWGLWRPRAPDAWLRRVTPTSRLPMKKNKLWVCSPSILVHIGRTSRALAMLVRDLDRGVAKDYQGTAIPASHGVPGRARHADTVNAPSKPTGVVRKTRAGIRSRPTSQRVPAPHSKASLCTRRREGTPAPCSNSMDSDPSRSLRAPMRPLSLPHLLFPIRPPID